MKSRQHLRTACVVFLVVTAWVLLRESSAAAAAPASNKLFAMSKFMDLLQQAPRRWLEALRGPAEEIFFAGATVTMGWKLYHVLGDDLKSLVSTILREMLALACLHYLVTDGPLIAQEIVEQLQTLGAELSTQAGVPASAVGYSFSSKAIYSPGALWNDAVKTYDASMEGITATLSGLASLVPMLAPRAFCALGIFLCQLGISVYIFVVKVESFVVLAGGSVLLGLGGVFWFRSVVSGYFRYAISAGVQLLFAEALQSLFMLPFGLWRDQVLANAKNPAADVALELYATGFGVCVLAVYLTLRSATWHTQLMNGAAMQDPLGGMARVATSVMKAVAAGYAGKEMVEALGSSASRPLDPGLAPTSGVNGPSAPLPPSAAAVASDGAVGGGVVAPPSVGAQAPANGLHGVSGGAKSPSSTEPEPSVAPGTPGVTSHDGAGETSPASGREPQSRQPPRAHPRGAGTSPPAAFSRSRASQGDTFDGASPTNERNGSHDADDHFGDDSELGDQDEGDLDEGLAGDSANDDVRVAPHFGDTNSPGAASADDDRGSEPPAHDHRAGGSSSEHLASSQPPSEPATTHHATSSSSTAAVAPSGQAGAANDVVPSSSSRHAQGLDASQAPSGTTAPVESSRGALTFGELFGDGHASVSAGTTAPSQPSHPPDVPPSGGLTSSSPAAPPSVGGSTSGLAPDVAMPSSTPPLPGQGSAPRLERNEGWLERMPLSPPPRSGVADALKGES